MVEFAKFYWLAVTGGPKRITVPNFVQIDHSVAEILRFFVFSRLPPPPSWIFKIVKFYWLTGSRKFRRISLPNFVNISQSVANILRFFDFSSWRQYPQRVLWGLYHPLFGWKMPIYAPKIGVFVQFDPLNVLQYQPKPQKAHPCMSLRHLSHQVWKCAEQSDLQVNYLNKGV